MLICECAYICTHNGCEHRILHDEGCSDGEYCNKACENPSGVLGSYCIPLRDFMEELTYAQLTKLCLTATDQKLTAVIRKEIQKRNNQ